jgi:hypothetical protein
LKRRLPPDAFAYFLGLGTSRSYQAVADHFGVSKAAVGKLALKEKWAEQVAQIEKESAEKATAKAVETLEAARTRWLRAFRAIQNKALVGLQNMSLTNAMDCVRALDIAVKHEALLLGQPTERTALEVEDVIKREYERWLTTADEPKQASADESVESNQKAVHSEPSSTEAPP